MGQFFVALPVGHFMPVLLIHAGPLRKFRGLDCAGFVPEFTKSQYGGLWNKHRKNPSPTWNVLKISKDPFWCVLDTKTTEK